jgi:ATP-dependent protease Clp ATPase subunit
MNDELDLPRLQRKTLISDEINFDWTDRIAWRHWLRVSLAEKKARLHFHRSNSMLRCSARTAPSGSCMTALAKTLAHALKKPSSLP